jgi:RimJ/RimL family protein N-acetyltransferase
MSSLTYQKMIFEDDADVSKLVEIYQAPEIARYLSISDNYFHYVTNNKNVHFYKVYKNDELIGTTHLEQQETVLFMDVLVFPKFQRAGLGTSIVKDIQDDIFELGYKSIEISIDEENIGSLRLFEKAGFAFVSKEAELLNFVYKKD